jgi:hypothetical protein
MREGFGPVMEVQLVNTPREEVQADLTLEEAQALEDHCGKLDWHYHEGKRRWLCIAEDMVTPPGASEPEPYRRRFMLTDELYKKLQANDG